MVIYIGADHRGFELKTKLFNFLKSEGYEIVDMGANSYVEDDDYPDFASAVAEKVRMNYENARGILLCGSGAGVSVVANKFPKVRSAVARTPDEAFDIRNDDDTNVLAIASDDADPESIARIVTIWLTTPFSGEARHSRRVGKIAEIEEYVNGLS